MATDFMGREITPGCTLCYPVRRGSSMWMVELRVQQIVSGKLPYVAGYNNEGRRVTVKNLGNCVVVEPRTGSLTLAAEVVFARRDDNDIQRLQTLDSASGPGGRGFEKEQMDYLFRAITVDVRSNPNGAAIGHCLLNIALLGLTSFAVFSAMSIAFHRFL